MNERIKKHLEYGIDWKNTKIMWKHANWFWRLAIVLGSISIIYLGFKLGELILNSL